MKSFLIKAGIYAAIALAFIALFLRGFKLSVDNSVIYSCIITVVGSFVYELVKSVIKKEKPIFSENVGAALAGSVVMGFIIYGIHLLIG